MSQTGEEPKRCLESHAKPCFIIFGHVVQGKDCDSVFVLLRIIPDGSELSVRNVGRMQSVSLGWRIRTTMSRVATMLDKRSAPLMDVQILALALCLDLSTAGTDGFILLCLHDFGIGVRLGPGIE